MNLAVDETRVDVGETGIFVRALCKGKWGSHDIATLYKESLLKFLRSREGDNPWAEDVIGILLGHGHLHQPDQGSVCRIEEEL